MTLPSGRTVVQGPSLRFARGPAAAHTHPVPPETIDLRLSADFAAAEERAAASLSRGGLVVLPTETVYGVAAAASNPSAMDRLWGLKGAPRRAPLAWHLHSSAALSAALWPEGECAAPALHRRAVHRLTPGPVTLQVPMDAERLRSVRSRVGVAEGVFDDGSDLLVRVPDQLVTRQVIERAGVPVVVAALGESRLASTAELAERALADRGAVELILDAGPTPHNRQSTLIRLDPAGGCAVVREGALDARSIRKRLTRHLLFVCTGNTCRSPMAAAIARHLIAAAPDGVETVVKSAGVSAGFGMQMTPEAAEAIVGMGVDPGRHASAPLSRELLNEADEVFAMTRGHLESVLRFDPTAVDRVRLLDPDGADIQDPIGSPSAVYDETARLLRAAIESRLKDLL